MLARELPRQIVQRAHALDGDQEGFVRRESGFGQRPDLLAQVVLQLRHIDGVNRLSARQVRPPLVDLLLESMPGDPTTTWFRPPVDADEGTADAGWDGGAELGPDAPERGVHRLPLLAFVGELGLPLGRDPIVLPAAAGVRDFPARLDVAEPLEAVQDRVEHAVGPLHVPARELPYPLQDGIPVAVLVGQDRQDQRGRGRGDEILVDLHQITRRASRGIRV